MGRDVFAVGASGAIFGLMGALLASAYRQRFSPARAVFSQLLLLLGINLALPLIVPNIAWEAHVRGTCSRGRHRRGLGSLADRGTRCGGAPGVGRSVSRHRGDGCGARRLIRAEHISSVVYN